MLRFLFELMGLRGLLVTGILIVVVGMLALAFRDLMNWILGIGLVAIAVIAVIEVLRR